VAHKELCTLCIHLTAVLDNQPYTSLTAAFQKWKNVKLSCSLERKNSHVFARDFCPEIVDMWKDIIVLLPSFGHNSDTTIMDILVISKRIRKTLHLHLSRLTFHVKLYWRFWFHQLQVTSDANISDLDHFGLHFEWNKI